MTYCVRVSLWLLAAVCVRAASAEACSCTIPPREWLQYLNEKSAKAELIYFGRVVTTQPRHGSGNPVIEVIERFKGNIEVGQRLTLTSSRSTCDLPLIEATTAIIYAREPSAPIGYCSGSRFQVSANDPELTWLRTGQAPVQPQAMRREKVTCERCDIQGLPASVLGVPSASRRYTSRRQPVDFSKPFLEMRGLDPRDLEHLFAHGINTDGRAFELVQTPADGSAAPCRQRVTRRWCEGLAQVAADAGATGPRLRCIDGGVEQVMCDENLHRTSTWGPLESTARLTCEWNSPWQPLCAFDAERDAGSIGEERPWLRCRATTVARNAYSCDVVD